MYLNLTQSSLGVHGGLVQDQLQIPTLQILKSHGRPSVTSISVSMPLRFQPWKWQHWLELSHVTQPNCKGSWEAQSTFVPREEEEMDFVE